MGFAEVQKMEELARQHHLAEIVYRKVITSDTPAPRIVETYSLTQGKQDIMVRAYQREPEEGWRYFMAHRIHAVRDTHVTFTPRRAITIMTGEIAQAYEPWPMWTDTLQEYRDIVLSALSDMVVTEGEIREAAAIRERSGITKKMMRSVHASVLMCCLQHVLEDGVLDTAEAKEIATLHECLRRLGWSIGD